MEYYIIENGERRGPFSLDQLATMNITSETLVWYEGLEDWKKAGDIDVVRAIIISRKAASAAQGDAHELKTTVPEPPAVQGVKRSWWSRYVVLTFVLLIIATLVAALYFTCPKKEAHKEALTVLANDVVKDEMNKLTGGVGRTFVQKLLAGVVENFYDDAFTTYDYKLFSVTKFDYDNHDNVVAVGVFGNVYTANKEVVAQYVEKKTKEVIDSQMDNLKKFLPQGFFKELYDTFVGGLMNGLFGTDGDDNADVGEGV